MSANRITVTILNMLKFILAYLIWFYNNNTAAIILNAYLWFMIISFWIVCIYLYDDTQDNQEERLSIIKEGYAWEGQVYDAFFIIFCTVMGWTITAVFLSFDMILGYLTINYCENKVKI